MNLSGGRGAIVRTCALLLLLGAGTLNAGLPEETYTSDQLYTVLARIESEQRDGQHGFPMYYNDHLIVTSERGFAAFDVSDPSNPVRKGTLDETLPEQSSFCFTNSYATDYVITAGNNGAVIWDFSDLDELKKIGVAEAEGAGSMPYSNRVECVGLQAPYLYVAWYGGFTILDISDPLNTEQVKKVDRNDLGIAWNIGMIYPIGNLLVVSGHASEGIATFDISDPAHPALLASDDNDLTFAYSSKVNGDRVYIQTKKESSQGCGIQIVDISDPATLVYEDFLPDLEEGCAGPHTGSYLSIQDDFIHFAASGNRYAKYRISTSEETGRFPQTSEGIYGGDVDFALGVENILFLSDDGNKRTYIAVHDREPDTTPPRVNMVNPKDQATAQAPTSAVGLTFTDQIDVRSVDQTTVLVRPQGGQVLNGTYSVQYTAVNFRPDQPLSDDMTYEIVVPAGGVKDLSGNAVEEEFVGSFSTGNAVAAQPGGRLRPCRSGRSCVYLSLDIEKNSEPLPSEHYSVYTIRGRAVDRSRYDHDGGSDVRVRVVGKAE